MNRSSILIIYTGGTIGMRADANGVLCPFDFSQILSEVPELGKFACKIDYKVFDPLIDSSDVEPEMWTELAGMIRDSYANYDGFVVLHGTDTMAYSASALSFMLENLSKPVIFTGSQLPIGVPRTDGKENLVSAVEIASAKRPDGRAKVCEVAIYFGSRLLRANRAVKVNSENFDAFATPNLDALGTAGINIRYNERVLLPPSEKPLEVHTQLDTRVSILKIHPGITPALVRDVLLGEQTQAVILETYGAGNAPSKPWFLDIVKEASARGKILVNVTQCLSGEVNMDIYATGRSMKLCGVVSGHDCTTEAMLAKIFYLLGAYKNESPDVKRSEIMRLLEVSLRGEIS